MFCEAGLIGKSFSQDQSYAAYVFSFLTVGHLEEWRINLKQTCVEQYMYNLTLGVNLTHIIWSVILTKDYVNENSRDEVLKKLQ